MTLSQPRSGGPTTEREFRANLRWLVRAAHDSGVDVEGGWMDRNENENQPDWGIEIYEVTKPSDSVDI